MASARWPVFLAIVALCSALANVPVPDARADSKRANQARKAVHSADGVSSRREQPAKPHAAASSKDPGHSGVTPRQSPPPSTRILNSRNHGHEIADGRRKTSHGQIHHVAAPQTGPPANTPSSQKQQASEAVAAAPTTLRTTVRVSAGPFGAPRIASPSEISLSGNDAKNLASAVPDDPLRALQALPGVTSDDDFSSSFSLHAADSSRIGLYLDGVLLHQPYFMVDTVGGTPSVSVLNTDLIDNLDLQSGVFPSQYGSSTAAAVDVESREGSAMAPHFRFSSGAANASAQGEGPLGKNQAGDWLFSVRKSYLQYLVNLTSPDLSPYAFGMFDEQGRVAYNFGNKNKLTLGYIDGYSGFNRDKGISTLESDNLKQSYYHFSLINLGWNYTTDAHFLATNHLAWMREALEDENNFDQNLDRGQYGEWVWNTDATWMWHSTDSFNFGWSMRRIRDDGVSRTFQYTGFSDGILVSNDYRGTALRLGGYAEQVWNAAHGRVTLTTGLRWDEYGVDRVQTVLPQATLALCPWQSTRLSWGFGQYAQEPDPNWAFSPLGGSRLLPERANSFVGTLEQRLGQHTRLRVEFYDRQDRDLLFRTWFELRLMKGKVYTPPLNPPIGNALGGYARGMEIFLQRSSGQRLSGWVSYSLGFSRLHDAAAAISFPADQDQRHTANAGVEYRLRPTVNLSVRSSYGSGMPVPGFFRAQNGAYYLSAQRNTLYNQPYARTDFRIDKSWSFDRWKLTFYAEALNVFDRDNPRFDGMDGYYPHTRQPSLEFTSMLPILPEAGVALEF